VDCVVVHGDLAFDHCVLRLSSVKFPRVYALLEYENQGDEPRLVGMLFRNDESVPQKEEYPLEWQKTLRLAGTRDEDPDKIAQWIDRELLNGAS
jgi:hypothetical protein